MKNLKVILPKIFFATYGIGAVGLAMAEIFDPHLVSDGASWGSAPGWLREMACFNFLVAFLCLMSLKKLKNSDSPRTVATGLALLSILLASNNAIVYGATGVVLHLQGALIHFTLSFTGIVTARSLNASSSGKSNA